ncbi:hypothetical protein [uncultured Microbacterium sp.]|uniref:hypothetical protein n=1 Tax=uncultured Microbacterium sp. TaxID=191216 RepID=UPI0026000330|nr:hypothetical protein [uncultured Microbacterium sp.]
MGLEDGIAAGRATAEEINQKRVEAAVKARRDEEVAAAKIIAVGKRAAEHLAAHRVKPQLEVTGGDSFFNRAKAGRKVWVLPYVDGARFAVTEDGGLYTPGGGGPVYANAAKAQERFARRQGFVHFAQGLAPIDPSRCHVNAATGGVSLNRSQPDIEYLVGKAIGLLEAQS